jgi:hypothetical protein
MWDYPPSVSRAFRELRLAEEDEGIELLLRHYGSEEELNKALIRDEAKIRDWDKSKTIRVNKELSEAVSKRVAELKGINPTIYETLETVMHYSALFRHYRTLDQAAYTNFVHSLDNVPLNAKVITPTVQRERALH